MALAQYSARIVDWNKKYVQYCRQKNQEAHDNEEQSTSSTGRLYLPRWEGGAGLRSVESAVRVEECSLSDYVRKNKHGNIPERDWAPLKKFLMEKEQNWKTKSLHGQDINKISDTALQGTRQWLIKGKMIKETEGMILAAQDPSIT